MSGGSNGTIAALIGLAATIATGIGSIVGLILRSIIKYLFDRIKVLEDREATVLLSLVEASKNQQDEIEATSQFVITLAKDRERQQWLNEQSGRT